MQLSSTPIVSRWWVWTLKKREITRGSLEKNSWLPEWRNNFTTTTTTVNKQHWRRQQKPSCLSPLDHRAHPGFHRQLPEEEKAARQRVHHRLRQVRLEQRRSHSKLTIRKSYLWLKKVYELWVITFLLTAVKMSRSYKTASIVCHEDRSISCELRIETQKKDNCLNQESFITINIQVYKGLHVFILLQSGQA